VYTQRTVKKYPRYEEQANLMMGGSDFTNPDLPGRDGDKGQWALFYWRLRYKFVDKEGEPDRVFERLKWSMAELRKAMDL
jgi:hypothetical protein